MADTPNNYKDPYWSQLASNTEQKLDLPAGLLSSIVNNGERSNNDQVSEAGARTPFQITPSTRKLAIDKYGIDPYLSPENAAEVAGNLIKDSLKRNNNDPSLAVAEYHGGTDQANWGKKTTNYVSRVMAGLQSPDGNASTGNSTFDKVQAGMNAGKPPSINNVYAAYKSGQMSPDDEAAFEQEVQSGSIMLPRGATLKQGAAANANPGMQTSGTQATQQNGTQVPQPMLAAYQSGQMSQQDRQDFESLVKSGDLQLPQGATLGTPDLQSPTALQKIGSIPGAIAESVTGTKRTTPDVQAALDQGRTLYDMPEANELSMGVIKSAIGGMFAGSKERAQIFAHNFPGVSVREDDQGNQWLKSAKDGQEYVIPPGFKAQDIPRAAAAVAAFAPAGGATTLPGLALRAGATQAAIEGTQAATGGEFNPKDVLTAAALAPVIPAAVGAVRAVSNPIRNAMQGMRGALPGAVSSDIAPAMAEAAPTGAASGAMDTLPGAATEAPITTPASTTTVALPTTTPTAAIPSSVEEVAQTARKAATGGMGAKSATQELADMAAPNQKTTAAAERLGIGDYLQSDHVTTNDAYRQTLGVLKSNPVSKLAQSEKEGLSNVAQRASNLIDEIGGTNDLSMLDASVKNRMQATHAELGARENGLYQQLREAIPASTEASATSALAFAEQRAKDLGGIDNLTPMEKQIVTKLSPKGGQDAALVDSLGPQARQQAIQQGAGGIKQPTYALLDDVRKDVGAAARAKGPFSDADSGLAKKYYSLLSEDQGAVAQQAGAGDIAAAARAATVARKGMEDDLASLFGKNLDQSIVPQLAGAMKSAANGDTSKLLAVLKATPDDMKQEVVASGMQTVFRNAATRGDISFTGYAKWYDNLLRNKQAYNAVMTNLPGPARKQLSDMYRVSKGISDSLNARIKTGLRSSVLDEMRTTDSLANRLYEAAKPVGKGMVADAMGGHGAGFAVGLMSVFSKTKTPALKAIDDLLTSDEFIQLAKAAGTPREAAAVRKFANSKQFTQYVRAIGQPRELSNRERWVMQAMQAHNQQKR